ncbi:MAG TPA: VOC family protein [Solimonas sp.]|nr:VOC family protein [Solimonas sp.]
MPNKITPFLWFDTQAEDAAKFYTSIFPNSKIGRSARYPEGSPGPAGSVMTVEFELDGQRYTALNGGPMFKFSEAFSLVVHCRNQEEVDYYWGKLMAGGGAPSQCGWLKDKFGFSWQIVPDVLLELTQGPDQARTARVFGAMMKMVKLDVRTLEEAACG